MKGGMTDVRFCGTAFCIVDLMGDIEAPDRETERRTQEKQKEIVLWSDGTKTVVKCGPEDTFDMEKGLAMAIIKKMAGNDNRFHKVFKQYTKKKKKEPGSIGSISDIMAGLNQAAAIATKTIHELAHITAAKAERGE